MDLKDMRLFLAIAEEKNLTRAAQKNGYTQSAASHMLRNIETELGFSLFSRSQRGLALTQNGEALLSPIRRTLAAAEYFDQTAASIRGVQTGHIRIGAYLSASVQWLPPALKKFLSDYPDMTVEVLDYQDGDEAGLKSASMMVKGANAYGLLKSENGVHRLVRVSPFDANARRQTSFASLEVMPELDNTIQVDIRPEDIEMQVYRSSGAGGQHINKTSSAVRLIHKPTGIVVNCQTQRSQFQNRDYAMEMLKAKLYQIAKQQHMDKIDDIKGVQNEIAWGHQIRSYVFMPYTMVKDHRTNYETGNVDAVMDGDIDEFIFAYLKAASRGELQDA